MLTSLTERGSALVAERRARFEPRWRRTLSGFSTDELMIASAVLERLREVFDDLAEDQAPERPAAQALPIYGSIAAGPTSLAEQENEGVIAVPNEFVDDTPHFVLTIKGDSMIGVGIYDGDFAVIRSNANPTNGDIVAAQVEGPTGEAEATVKRFRREGGKVLLIPENPTMSPIEAPADVRILGKVVALLRRF